MNAENLDPALDRRLRDLIFRTGIPLRVFSTAIGASTEDTLKWWASQGCELSWRHFQGLAQYLGVSEEQLLNSDCTIPYDLIRRRIFEGPDELPDQYSAHASSCVRSSAHIVDFLALKYGRKFIDDILMKLNVHPLVYNNLDNRINLRFFIDLLNTIRAQGLTQAEIDSLACYIFLRIQETRLGDEFRKVSTYEACYSVLEQYSHLFDSNFEYRFEIERSKILITAKPTEAAPVLAECSPQDYQLLFSYKRKLMGWFPIISRLAPLKAESPKCVSKGDPFTIYQFNLPSGDKPRPEYLRVLSDLEA